MHIHQIEEIEYRTGPKLWDAGEGVCCAAYQLGGDCCTPPPEYDEADELTREERVELYGEAVVAETERLIATADARLATTDDEPF